MAAIRVLVVDDEEDFATAIVARLKKRGYEASAVFGGQEALARIRERPCDVLILDLKMPRMDGLETLRALRDLPEAPQVILLTGHGTVLTAISGMQLGAVDFLQKPVAIETLCTAIDAAAERARADRDTE